MREGGAESNQNALDTMYKIVKEKNPIKTRGYLVG